jgi:anti-anti-sigma factor
MIVENITNDKLTIIIKETFTLSTGEQIMNLVKDPKYEKCKIVELLFQFVDYINSDGCRKLVELLKYLKDNNKMLILSNLNNVVKDIMSFTNLDKLFTIV